MLKKSLKGKRSLLKLKLLKKLKASKKEETKPAIDEVAQMENIMRQMASKKKKARVLIVEDEDEPEPLQQDSKKSKNKMQKEMDPRVETMGNGLKIIRKGNVRMIVNSDKEEESSDSESSGAPILPDNGRVPYEYDENSRTVNKGYNQFHISIGFPDSVIQKCQSFDLRNYMISKIARFAALNMVDELVLLKDHSFLHRNKAFSSIEEIAKILQYLETPQYLRKALFPISKELKNVGLMSPLESVHHLLVDDYQLYREGVVLKRPTKNNQGSWVDIGLWKHLILDKNIVPGTRVTVKVKEDYSYPTKARHWTGKAVSPLEPKRAQGLYWGYKVRTCDYFSDFEKSATVKGGYQLKILVDQRHGTEFLGPVHQEVKNFVNKNDVR